ncbi:hypothetical protein M8C21_003042 [Ambrosia artemisiifolia]|uniref:EF-hand domain-containing protein n=1 Tax=Ambrosia artemisiifolia TaxID=4212 RepID=A0AAD5D2R3_AMBAR|nr:hypothetical protein M8C21_003042 [Ambrosia artemisiifolia]
MGLKNLFNRKKKPITTTTQNDAVSPSVNNSHHQIETELTQVFKKFDVNGDGKISSTELGSIMGSLGHRPTDEELEMMISNVDSDGDGFIDLNEFIELNTKGVGSTEVLESLKEAFSVFDIDKNGLISAEELQKVLGRLEEECTIGECRKMIAGVDVDGDGMISFEEFRGMMMRVDGFGFDKERMERESQL